MANATITPPVNMIISSLYEVGRYHGQVSYVLSIVDPDDASSIPSLGVAPDRHLILLGNDVSSRAEAVSRAQTLSSGKCIAPTRTMVKKALAFAKALPPNATVVLHCGAGVSRSPAIALAVLCQAQPDLAESEVYKQFLRLRPQAFPNARIVQLADKLLGRDGRMCRAITAA